MRLINEVEINQLLSDWQNPHWWISVVVIGLVLNIVSTYIKSWLEAAFKRMAGWVRSRSAQATQRYLERARVAAASDRGLIKEIALEQRHRGSAALWVLFAILLLVVAICMALANQSPRTIYMIVLGAVFYCVIEVIRSVFAALNSSVILDVAEAMSADKRGNSTPHGGESSGRAAD